MKVIFSILLFLVPVSFIIAQDDSDELTKLLEKIQSFEANFIQQRYSNSRGLEDSTSGRFILQRPNQFLWQTSTPFAQTIVSNGEALWTIDVDLEQVIISPLDEEIQNAPILLLAREQADLDELFDIEKQSAEEATYFILRPKDTSGNFERLRIGFDDTILSTLELYDSLGQLTRITMTNSRHNPIVDISQFQPEIPEDYDVIDSRPIESEQ